MQITVVQEKCVNSRVEALGVLPPLAEIRRNRRIRWYRCPIEAETLRELVQPSDVRGLLQAVGHLAIWVATGSLAYTFFTLEIWWGFCLFLFLHGTVAAFFTAAHHELCHTTVFRTRWLNEFFLRVFSFLGWLNFEIYRFSHSYHHRFTLFVEGDREEVMPENPSLGPLYLLQLFTVNITGGYHARGLVPTLRNFVRIASNRMDKTQFLYWYMNWHVEHHMYGAVPCYNLEKLHRAVAHDMPEPRTLIGAWKEMRETWRRRQQEPDYEHDTPVPAPKTRERADNDPLAASMGGLTPRALA